jgi:glutamate-5-semialdehyde dehydrogenase
LDPERLTRLEAGMPIVYGGDRVARVPAELAAAFQPGDRLVVVQGRGDLLHIPAADAALVEAAVGAANEAFATLSRLPDAAITAFYEAFAARIEDDAAFGPVLAANAADVERARAAGRSTTRLALSPAQRADMAAGLRGWAAAPSIRDQVVERIEHDGWSVEQRKAGLGVIGFVFEGRPNVFADATGVLRAGNTVVFRIGSDALGTAEAMVASCLAPALAEAGLPAGAAVLLATPSRAAGWALFADSRLSLAVARGSGPAVEQLGAVARQAGTTVSLHGTGGAWLVTGRSAAAGWFGAVVEHSLDRKVCNTLNVCCVLEERAPELVPRFVAALASAAARRGVEPKLHVVAGSQRWVEPSWFETEVAISRAEGEVREAKADVVPEAALALEWEWEASPEVTLVVVGSVSDAVALANRYSPRFVASLVADDESEHEAFWAAIDAPFVGNGFTRWVDGQYALGRPELGLSNWQFGRLFGRGGVLSGDTAFTVRTRVTQHHPDLHR